MTVAQPPINDIARYAGPYERWTYTQRLGKPFAFPAIAEPASPYFTALLEGGAALPSADGITTRLPPLWNPLERPRSVLPFAFHDPSHAEVTDNGLADTLAKLSPESPEADAQHARYRVNFPVAQKAWASNYHPQCDMDDWVIPTVRPKAIVAVIDDGLPFAHRAFLDSTGATRISHIWLQAAETQGREAVPFGRELMNGDINSLLAQHPTDEDRIYREAGAVNLALDELGGYLRRHATHGAHVLGMAAGNDARLASHPMGDDIQIIAVQLPNTIAWDTSGFGKEAYMLSALHYVFNRARAIAEKYGPNPDDVQELPLIVNFSYGWSASRHDGRSEMELAIEELLSERKTLQADTAIVMPTGNNFANEMHGQITAADMESGTYKFGWKIAPDDKTSSYLELWFPEGFDPDEYTVIVDPPHETALSSTGKIDVSADPSLKDKGDPRRFLELEIDGKIIGQLSADKHRGSRWRVMLALIPSVYTRNQPRAAPSGCWEITLKRNNGASLPAGSFVNVWVQRDDDPNVLGSGGRQSHLVDLKPKTEPTHSHPLQDYSGELEFVRGYGCYNGVASAPSVTRVAGHVASVQRPSRYSGAAGLTLAQSGALQAWSVRPALSAPADQSRALEGTLSIGVRSGSGMRLVGTSGASPMAARLMALNAAAGRDLLAGFGPALPLADIEKKIPKVLAQHGARTGNRTADHVSRKQPPRTLLTS